MRFAMLREASFIFSLSFHAFRNISSFRVFLPTQTIIKSRNANLISGYYASNARAPVIPCSLYMLNVSQQIFIFLSFSGRNFYFALLSLMHLGHDEEQKEKLLSRWLISNEIFPVFIVVAADLFKFLL